MNRDASNVEDALDNFDTIVLFKVGSKLPAVLEILEKKGLLEQGSLFSYLGTPEQMIERDLTKVKREKIGYMSLLIVKKKKAAIEEGVEEDSEQAVLEPAAV